MWNLPVAWFSEVPAGAARGSGADGDSLPLPSPRLLQRVFESFGRVRAVDVPVCDPYRRRMKPHMQGASAHALGDEHSGTAPTLFEAYVQYAEHVGFVRTMDALRGMKLAHKQPDGTYHAANIGVDFDRTKHLSDAAVRRRQIVRDRLMDKDREADQKELDFKRKLEQEELANRLHNRTQIMGIG